MILPSASASSSIDDAGSEDYNHCNTILKRLEDEEDATLETSKGIPATLRSPYPGDFVAASSTFRSANRKQWKHSCRSISSSPASSFSIGMILLLLQLLQLSSCYTNRVVHALSSPQLQMTGRHGRLLHQRQPGSHPSHSLMSIKGRLGTTTTKSVTFTTRTRRTRLWESSSSASSSSSSEDDANSKTSYLGGRRRRLTPQNSTTTTTTTTSSGAVMATNTINDSTTSTSNGATTATTTPQTTSNRYNTIPTAPSLVVDDLETVSSSSYNNGVSQSSNGYNTPNNNSNNEAHELQPETEEEDEEDTQAMERRIAKTAPEINHWTDIMMKGMFFKKNKEETVDQIYKDLRDMSSYDCEQVDIYWDQLMPTVSYLGTHQVAKIYDALRVAYRAHRGQMRKSGEPFIIHPVEVALLLSGLKMDGETVKAGLLHDTVEDTDLTFELVEGMFGEVVRSIVEGETKVSKLPKLAFSDYADEQAENLRQMFVAMTDDYRIIIVKLADRLHNMRTLRHMKPAKQIKISRETLDIFAPLAHRMGIWQFKSELEDTAFMYLYPQEYKRLNRRLRQHQTKFRDTLDKSKEILTKVINSDPTLNSQASDVNVSGRTKEIYSLWHKMETKGERNLDHIVDVVALRVIITPNMVGDEEDDDDTDRGVWLCYHVLGLVQHLPGFQPVPTRVKDYISFPKPNGYQSLHTALILNGQTIEVQIRTSMMHQVAEYGMASHWAYTDGKKQRLTNNEFYNTPWLSSIKEWQNDILSARDFVDSVRSELLGKRVFVFLRNGKILNLARGATAIDAAFQIHTEVGLNMHGVEINGNLVPFAYELQNGDVVSILTGKGKPSTDWMRYAKSRSTRSKLRSYFRARQKESLREAGQILIMDYLSMHGSLIVEASYMEEPFSIPSNVEELASLLPGNTQFDNIDDLLITIGKQHDRALLHQFASKIFKVPQRLLVDAETDKEALIPKSVLAAVNESRRDANDAGQAAASARGSTLYEDEEDDDDEVKAWPTPSLPLDKAMASVFSKETRAEYADPEHLCEDCLPVFGDQIVGTKREHTLDAIPIVHRIGCPHAQRAINSVLSENRRPAEANNLGLGQRVDSVTLRRSVQRNGMSPSSMTGGHASSSVVEVPVKLRWSDEERTKFLCEIVVHAQDRKLLLADASEVVSELSEIVKTGSQTTNEHATLVFLVYVRELDHLQKLMDSLGHIRSVMAVERRFGAELL